MDFSNIPYYIKSGIKDALHNRAMTLSSIIITIIGLCVLGAYLIISMNVNYLTQQVYSQYVITAYIEKEVPSERIEEMCKEMKKIEGIKSINVVTEAQALEDCKEMFGEDSDFLEGLESNNPLRGSLELTIDDIAQSESISEKVQKITDVAWVKSNRDIASKLTASTSLVRKGSVILMLIFFAASLFIISNTIKITIIARQQDIYTMRYLGAINRFIAIPFVVEGIVIGIVGAVISYVLISGGYIFVSHYLNNFLGEVFQLYQYSNIGLALFAEILLSGLIMGALSSVIPLSKYMKV